MYNARARREAAAALPEGSSLARELRARSLDLVAACGFHEYFDPRDGTGRGGERFRWTAALTLDWLGP